MLRRAVPIRPACDSQARLEFATSSPQRRMRRQNRNLSGAAERTQVSTRARARRLHRRRLVNRADDRTGHDHLDQTADGPIPKQFGGEGLHCVHHQSCSEGKNLHQDAELDPRKCAAAGETAGKNKHKCANQNQLTDDEPGKSIHHFSLWPPQIRRLGIYVLHKDLIENPSPKEHEDKRGDECEEEFFPVHNFFVKSCNLPKSPGIFIASNGLYVDLIALAIGGSLQRSTRVT